MAMTDEHKVALAEGRAQARTIKLYLEALGDRRPGRPVTPKSLKARLVRIEEKLETEDDVLKRLDLIQRRIDVREALAKAYAASKVDELEAAFVDVAYAYSERKGVTYAAWREIGVRAATLERAGISRSSS